MYAPESVRGSGEIDKRRKALAAERLDTRTFGCSALREGKGGVAVTRVISESFNDPVHERVEVVRPAAGLKRKQAFDDDEWRPGVLLSEQLVAQLNSLRRGDGERLAGIEFRQHL
jgi:hypothetical protein